MGSPAGFGFGAFGINYGESVATRAFVGPSSSVSGASVALKLVDTYEDGTQVERTTLPTTSCG
jgi:hypothetical protein